jgi:hypothetical protein
MASPKDRVITNITTAQVLVEKAMNNGEAADMYPPHLIMSKCGHVLVNAATTGVNHMIMNGLIE